MVWKIAYRCISFSLHTIQSPSCSSSPLLAAFIPRARPDTESLTTNNFMQHIEFRTRIESCALSNKESLGCCCAVDDNYCRVSQLNLEDWPIYFSPLSIHLGV